VPELAPRVRELAAPPIASVVVLVLNIEVLILEETEMSPPFTAKSPEVETPVPETAKKFVLPEVSWTSKRLPARGVALSRMLNLPPPGLESKTICGLL